MKDRKRNLVFGWIAVGITLIVTSLWTYWGSIENFHEGWYSESLFENIFMFLFQYLLVVIILIALALTSLKWKLPGAILHLVLAGFSIWFFYDAHFVVLWLMIVLPILVLGVLYYFGNPKPLKLAKSLIISIPLVILIVISIPQGIKVGQRVNDNDFGLRIVEGNGVTLAWAPRGVGWPDEGGTWFTATQTCRYLSEDGTTLMEEEQNVWRLPSIDEAVRSMMLHGENAGGVWDEDAKVAVYEKTPDKETPLWNVHSPVIYYWTSQTDEANEQRAYIIVYHGGVYTKTKADGPNYLSFRAVKNV
ncbi:MAG: DUF1566 domain-containing protein [Bacilli bacterium]